MKKFGLILMAALLLAVVGCSSRSGGVDESAIEARITSEPAAVAATPLKLTVEIEGIEELLQKDDLKIDFDIREETEQELPVLLTSTQKSDKEFEVEHEFPAPGKYVIYIHIYSGDDIHIIKRNEFQVG
ncbi:hypothetical protein HGI30_11500 [Paenibacillus albicereus]|uniref:YtkA-like domain-containing protein n=1 Tax=Paenibacillus albicereus TaxID=2726185 RepID=A0A6H2GXN9_9BACL|nr:hypothetical protein [Paenibacillus albicereus]QJC52119.1 hypothetical protein HGI30_11500 [Paenibacillus albicereus]